MDSNKKITNLFIVMLLVFSFLSFLFDDFIFQSIVGYQYTSIKEILKLFTHSISIFIFLVVLPSFALYRQKKVEYIYMLLISFFSSAVISFLIKMIVARPRPLGVITYPASFFNIYSFPSTHAAIAFSVMPILFLFFKKERYLILIYGLLIALSRIYFKVHYFSDIIFGAFVGYLIGIFILHFKEIYRDFAQKRHDQLEIRRQFIHIILGLIIVAMIKYEFMDQFILLYSIIIIILISFLSRKYKFDTLKIILARFERKKDLMNFPLKGLIFYLIGTFVVVILFPKGIAMASIAILAVSDSVSHIIGYYGKLKNPFSNTKYFEGFIAGVILGFAAASFFVTAFEAFAASFGAMVVESFDIRLFKQKIDDNLIMPIISGTIIWMIRILF